MNLLKTIIPSSPETLDTLTASLSAMGIDCVQIEDERDIMTQSPYWEMTDESVFEYYRGACRVIVYLPDTPDGYDTLRQLQRFNGVTTESIAEESWAENWKQYYKPIIINDKLVIHPVWEPMGDYSGKTVYLSNPGVSFGTGIHASTRLCLDRIADGICNGKSVLDVGCGSGILGICALLMDAEDVFAVDVDSLATDITIQNAKLNGVDNKIITASGDFTKDESLRKKAGSRDVVFSNIVADVIIALTPYVKNILNANGTWIIAGIIDTLADEVTAALVSSGYHVKERYDSGGWVALEAVIK